VIAGVLTAALILLGLLGFRFLPWRTPSGPKLQRPFSRYSSILLGFGAVNGCGWYLVRRLVD
jgi:hypothetical protein